MAKKIYLSPSSQSENAYATGSTNEQAQCRKIATACAEFLKKHGFEVKCANYGTMYTRTSESNSWGADLHVPIHTNAFNGKVTGGTQIYMLKLSGEHKKVGQAVFDRLAPLTVGTSHEKLVQNSSFYEIKRSNALCVYCECEFHDTIVGANYIINNAKAIGEAIAKGICDYYGVKVSTETETPKEDVKKAYTGAFPTLPSKGYFEKGDEGTQVKNLQKFLNWYGGYKLVVDGDFGTKTLTAVKDFQKKTGLTVDGLFGAKSLAKAKTITK